MVFSTEGCSVWELRPRRRHSARNSASCRMNVARTGPYDAAGLAMYAALRPHRKRCSSLILRIRARKRRDVQRLITGGCVHHGWTGVVSDCGGGLYGFVVRHNLNGGDDGVARAALQIVPGVGVQFVLLRFVLHEGLIAFAGFAVDFLSRHTFIFARNS